MSRLLPGNDVRLLVCGMQYFPALEQAINAARSEIFLETYIFADDDTGRRIATALARAARRGVRVRVLVDGFGAREFELTHQRGLEADGVHVLTFRPEVGRLSFRRNRLRRMHRKMAVIDGETGFVGGINIIDDMHTPGHTPPRFDYAVRVEGPLLAPIHAAAHHLWWLLSWASLRQRPPRHAALQPPAPRAGTVRAAFLVRDSLRHRRDIEEAYLAALAEARREVVIACAYFLPGRRFRQALIDAARRGCNVVLLLQGRVEYLLLHFASRALYPHLLGGGVRIFEYHRSFLHAKVAVVDRHWATVGSSNIDPFSLMLAREANLVVRDIGFAETLHGSLQQAMQAGARELRPEAHRKAPWHQRVASWLAYGVVRLIMGVVGVGRDRR